MRKIFFLFFFLALISLSLASFAQLSYKTFAQELSIKEATDYSLTETGEKVQKVQYELPYPGILPDHPLYFLKMIRDQIVGFLIADPLKKAEFNLLQADKRLNTGVYLINKDKDKNARLAQSTISKGQNYFEEAIAKVEEAQKQGMDTKDILRRLSNSSKKHQEVLQLLESEAPQDLKADYNDLQKRVKDFAAEVASLMSN